MQNESSTLWSRVPLDVWTTVMEHLPRPLTPGQVEADLQHLLALHRFRGERFPSSRVLSERWGWGRQRVRTLLKASNPLATQHQPTANPPPTHRHKGETALSEPNNPPATQHQPTANPPATTRALGKEREREIEREKDCRPIVSADEVKPPSDYDQVLAYLTKHRPTAQRWRRSKGNGQELAKLTKELGVQQAKRLIDLAYTSSQEPHPFNRKRGNGHPPIATLRRHGQRYLDEEADSTSPAGRRGAYRGPANPKPLPTHEEMLAMLAEPAPPMRPPWETKEGA